MVEFGYVKIIKGVHSGRIGRYVRNDTDGKKGIVSFQRQIDFIPHCNYLKLPISYLSNRIEDRDLIERYYDIMTLLQQIHMKGHRTIRKYSSDHSDLMSECDLVYSLLKERFLVEKLDLMKKEKNIIVFSSFKDQSYLFDMISDLLFDHYHVGIEDHEMIEDINYLDDIHRADAFIFVLSKNSIQEKWLLKDYEKIKEIYEEGWQKIIFIKIDDCLTPSFIKDEFQMNEVGSSQYNESYHALLSRLESYE